VVWAYLLQSVVGVSTEQAWRWMVVDCDAQGDRRGVDRANADAEIRAGVRANCSAKKGIADLGRGYIARRIRAGRVMRAPTSSSAPPTAMPTMRNGSRISQTIG
jgi:hypothetical protein